MQKLFASLVALMLMLMVSSVAAQDFSSAAHHRRTNTFAWDLGLHRRHATGDCRRHTYEIELKDGRVVRRAARIEKYRMGDILVAGGGSRHRVIIKPDSTVRMHRVRRAEKKLLGVPFGGGWVFRVVTGRIAGYSDFPEYGTYRVSYMQLAPEGPIVPVNCHQLGRIMAGHDQALDLLRENKIGAAIERYNRDVDEPIVRAGR